MESPHKVPVEGSAGPTLLPPYLNVTGGPREATLNELHLRGQNQGFDGMMASSPAWLSSYWSQQFQTYLKSLAYTAMLYNPTTLNNFLASYNLQPISMSTTPTHYNPVTSFSPVSSLLQQQGASIGHHVTPDLSRSRISQIQLPNVGLTSRPVSFPPMVSAATLPSTRITLLNNPAESAGDPNISPTAISNPAFSPYALSSSTSGSHVVETLPNQDGDLAGSGKTSFKSELCVEENNGDSKEAGYLCGLKQEAPPKTDHPNVMAAKECPLFTIGKSPSERNMISNAINDVRWRSSARVVQTSTTTPKKGPKDSSVTKPYTCTICLASYHHKFELNRHVKVSHVRPHRCEHCGKGFGHRNYLRMHVETVHLGRKSYECKFCGKFLSTGGNLNVHVRTIHFGEKKYNCPVCNRSFGQQCNMKTHMRRHAQKDQQLQSL